MCFHEVPSGGPTGLGKPTVALGNSNRATFVVAPPSNLVIRRPLKHDSLSSQLLAFVEAEFDAAVPFVKTCRKTWFRRAGSGRSFPVPLSRGPVRRIPENTELV
jgi:hypothetical protein